MTLIAEALLVIVGIAVVPGSANEPEFNGKTVGEWKKQLQDADSGARLEAALALGRIGPRAKAAVTELSELLKDGDRFVRSCAADALGLIGPDADEGISSLIKALDDKDAIVRICAARALGRIGISKVPGLPDLVTTRHPEATLPVARALSERGPKDRTAAVSILTGFLQRDSLTPSERVGAACILGSMGPDAKAAVAVLTRLLREKKSIPYVAEALTRIGPDGSAAAMPILTSLTRDPDERVRSSAAEALTNIEIEAKKKQAGESKPAGKKR